MKSTGGERKRTLHRNLLLPVGYRKQKSALGRSKIRPVGATMTSDETTISEPVESDNDDDDEQGTLSVYQLNRTEGTDLNSESVEIEDEEEQSSDGVPEATPPQADSPSLHMHEDSFKVPLVVDEGEEISPYC